MTRDETIRPSRRLRFEALAYVPLCRVRQIVRSLPAVRIALRWCFRGHRVTPDTHLCIEGAERCGNTFAFHLVQALCPDIRIGHHTHCVANLKLARRYSVPAITLVRNPTDAICSSIVRQGEVDGGSLQWRACNAVARYEYFYNWTADNQAILNIVSFETLTSDTPRFAGYVDSLLGREDNGDPARIRRATTRAREELVQKVAGEPTGNMRAFLPDEERNRAKAAVLPFLEMYLSKELAGCFTLYNRLRCL